MPHFQKLHITHPFEKSGIEFPTFYQRINDSIFLKSPVVIPIDGKSQSGKTQLARHIGKSYDEDFRTFWQVKDFIKYFFEIKDHLEIIDGLKYVPQKYYCKWLLFEEPQGEMPTMQFWSDRNWVMQQITSEFGFLLNGLLLPMPNIKGISPMIYTNITFRMSIVKYRQGKEVVRKAYIKKPIWLDNKNKYIWITVESYKIPFIEDDKQYKSDKIENFFYNDLPEMAMRLKMDSFDFRKINEPILKIKNTENELEKIPEIIYKT